MAIQMFTTRAAARHSTAKNDFAVHDIAKHPRCSQKRRYSLRRRPKTILLAEGCVTLPS
jgi:hypothetical protein